MYFPLPERRQTVIEELYTSFYKELTAWCQRKTHDAALSEDLVQETFVRALKHFSLLESLDIRQQRAWMYRTLKNLYVDHIRHNAFETATESLPEFPEDEAAFSDVNCRQILNVLPDEEKVLFILRYLAGYNSTEISKIFGLPPGTVRSRLSSARKRLRKIWY